VANVAPPGLATFTYPASVLISGTPTVVQLPAVEYRLFTYDAGTSTPRTTWSDAGETVPNANPIILDANGQAQIFYRGNYRLELRQPVALGGAVIWTVDSFNVPDPSASSSIQFANGTAATPSIRFAQATSSGLYSPSANQVAMSISGVQAMLWASGNVGIGGTPTQKLDVFGTARVQGTFTVTTGGIAVTAGGATITAGGLTVAAGGATITGNSSVAGNFAVSSGTFTSRGFADNATAAHWNITSAGFLANNGNAQPGFAARRITSSQTTAGNVVFQDTAFAGGWNSGMYDTGTGVATVPTGGGGKFIVLASCAVDNTSGGTVNPGLALRVNGVDQLRCTFAYATGTGMTYAWVTCLSLAAGDTVTVRYDAAATSAVLIGSHFSMWKVG
jgi:hypothetical protein